MFKKEKSNHSMVKSSPLPSIKDLFQKSWLMFREKLRLIILISLLGLLPSVIAAILLAVISAIFAGQDNFFIINNSLALLMLLLLMYVSFRINIAICLVVAKSIKTVKEAWHKAGALFWQYLITMLWLVVIAAAWIFTAGTDWFILAFIVGFITSVLYAIVVWVFFIEDYHGFAAISRARELISGYWAALSLRMLALYAPLFIFIFLIDNIENRQIFDFIYSIANLFYGIFLVIYTYQIYSYLVKTKSSSKVERRNYPLWVYAIISLVYILLFIAMYLFVVFSPTSVM